MAAPFLLPYYFRIS